MDEVTLTALQGSIKKWEEISAGTGVDLGMENCPLCQQFTGPEIAVCNGCPVAAHAKAMGCDNTPYEKWSDMQNAMGRASRDHWTADTDRLRELAAMELAFLRSLLPVCP